jgi:hypothetical protein
MFLWNVDERKKLVPENNRTIVHLLKIFAAPDNNFDGVPAAADDSTVETVNVSVSAFFKNQLLLKSRREPDWSCI